MTISAAPHQVSVTYSVGEIDPNNPSLVFANNFVVPFPYLTDGGSLYVYLRSDNGEERHLVDGPDYILTNGSLKEVQNGIYGRVFVRRRATFLRGITIARSVPAEQNIKFDEMIVFSRTTEWALDRLTTIAQDSNIRQFAIGVANDDWGAKAKITHPLKLPSSRERAGKYFIFNRVGGAAVTSDVPPLVGSVSQPDEEPANSTFAMSRIYRKNSALAFDNNGDVDLVYDPSNLWVRGGRFVDVEHSPGESVISSVLTASNGMVLDETTGELSSGLVGAADESTIVHNGSIQGNYKAGKNAAIEGNEISLEVENEPGVYFKFDLLASNWKKLDDHDYYYQEVQGLDVRYNDTGWMDAIVSDEFSQAVEDLKQWNYIDRVVPLNGVLVFWCFEQVPTRDLVIQCII